MFLNTEATVGHRLLILHVPVVLDETASNLLDALVDTVLSEMASIEISHLPSIVLGILQQKHTHSENIRRQTTPSHQQRQQGNSP